MNFDIFDTHLEAILVLSADEKIIYCNDIFAQICELSRRKIIGKIKFRDLVKFPQASQEMKPLDQITLPTPYVESLLKVGENQEYRIQYTVQKLENESQWLVFFKDVTLEERLQKKYRAELEQKEGVISQLEQAKLQLEDYSKNLEKKVQERSEEILKLNVQMKALLDSLTQGFLIFNSEGDCLNVFSQACQTIFQKHVAGTKIWDLFHLKDDKTNNFKKWMMTLFSEMLPFEDLKPLGPERLHIAESIISLDYYPLRGQTSIEGVVVVATDITNLIQAQTLAQQEKVRAQFILQIVTRRTQFAQFVRECNQMLEHLKLLANGPALDAEKRNDVLRILHTLKGGASIYSLPDFPELCHQMEEKVKNHPEMPPAILFEIWIDLYQDFSRHINQAKLILSDRFMSEIKWYEINSKQVSQWLADLNQPALAKNPSLNKIRLELTQIEYLPAGHFFEPYRELTEQLAKKLEKSLRPMIIRDHQIKLAPDPYSQIFGTFVHLVRNAVDHGIEMPQDRISAGKPAEGQLMISVQQVPFSQEKLPFAPAASQMFEIILQDDGKGISADVIKESLLRKLPDQESRWKAMGSEELIEMIFMPEFSTQSQVTDISGRGVGLDAVKASVEEFSGKIQVETELGKGTKFKIYLPMGLQTAIPATKAA